MPLRVCIIQGVVPHYRVAIFDRLARTSDIDLEVWGHLGPARSSLLSAVERGAFRCQDAPERSIGPFLWQPGQLGAARSGRFDVIIFTWNQRYLHLRPALRAAQSRGIGTCVWGHGYSKRDSSLKRRRRNALLRHCDACLVYGDAAARALAAEGVRQEMLFVARNAIDQEPIRAAISEWNRDPQRLERFRREQGLEGAEVVLLIARVEPEKRVELLVEAVARLRGTLAPIRLVVIGEGSAVASVQATARRLGIADLLRMPGATYDELAIAPWCLAAKCAAYPAAIGLSILHDFGYALPVITSDDPRGHGPEIAALADGVNGLLFRAGDAADLAEKLAICLRDGTRREAMALAAKATVTGPDGFTLDAMHAGMMAAIQHCASRAGARRKR